MCIVKAKITPEHKIHKKAYTVEVHINEQEEIVLSSVCTDCTAASGMFFMSLFISAYIHLVCKVDKTRKVDLKGGSRTDFRWGIGGSGGWPPEIFAETCRAEPTTKYIYMFSPS